MSLYKFKSSQCSPCNQSSQRRRKVYRCWVSSSPIKRAKHETCKYDVNHHGCAHHQDENQIHFFQCRKDQWNHLTTDVRHLLTDVIFSQKLRVDAIDEILAGISILLDSQSFVNKGKGLLGRTFDLKSAYKQFGVDVPHSEKKKPGGGVAFFRVLALLF